MRAGRTVAGALATILLAAAPATAASTTRGGLAARVAAVGAPGVAFTPLAGSTLSRPTAVEATDGRYHIAYELLLTNTSPLPARVERVEVRDARTGRTLSTLSGAALTANINPVAGTPAQPGEDSGDPAPPARDPAAIPPSSASIVWLDVAIRDRAQLPRALVQRVTTALTRPSGEVAHNTSPAGRVSLLQRKPAVLGPPLGAGIWVADEGCCTVPTHHRRSLQTIDGELIVSQRFAIDWMKLDAHHRAWSGRPTDPASYFSWNEPEYAVGAGTVVAAQDGLRDYPVPHGPHPAPALDEALGNNVIVRIGPATYVTYAHMRSGSVRVRVGQRVRRGQLLGRLGNSGNSSTPHLHMQVQTTSYALSNGNIPYVFDRLDLLGQITEVFSDETLGLRPTGTLPYAAAVRPGLRRAEMPLDRAVLRFPGAPR
ncbi:MAG: Peptidase [Conexibacter sp.]|nr:Peptidase [Conexibacter sp.]